jgi:hypothetical protein
MFRQTDLACNSAVRAQPALIAALGLVLAACGGTGKPGAQTGANARRVAQVRTTPENAPYTDVKVDAAGEALAVTCEPGAYEKCNAIDDDCNGVIDDECGYEGGEVQITVGWDSGADIDMYVTDPSGATLFYNDAHKRSRIGGHLDHDARGDCRREQQNPRIENAYWPSPAKAGNYRVQLHYFSPCAKGATTEATLTVAVDSQPLGTYRFKLEPEQRIDALSFVKR